MQKELQMKQFDTHQLGQFTGTSRYYRISHRHLLTDGTRYLAEQAACFWLMDAIASHLSEIDTAEWFVVIKTTVKRRGAVMVYQDGDGKELAHIDLYACWDSEHWVIMLPSEY
jgi:hypothetical protein